MSLSLRGTHTVCMPAFLAPCRLPIVSSAMIVSKGLIGSAGSRMLLMAASAFSKTSGCLPFL